MKFIETQNKEDIEHYKQFLKAVGGFSNLYSTSSKPYIQYRVAENVFAKAFKAENLARADVAYDAVVNGYGIGIKTFILSGASKIEKVAEFNAYSAELRGLAGIELAKRLAYYRNERIGFADRAYDIQNRIYHIIGRDKGVIKVFEVHYELIDVDSIVILHETRSSLKFRDRSNEYNFNFSKSVLMMRFNIPKEYLEIEVDIIHDPIGVLMRLSEADDKVGVFKVGAPQKRVIFKRFPEDLEMETESDNVSTEELVPGTDYIILPLYSPKAKANAIEPIIPVKSQLNQWNAGGRMRDPGEVYIPIPAEIHKLAPGFLPPKDYVFHLKVPNGDILNAKVCQQGDKALMSNPNNALSDWLLRKVFKLKENEILEYDRLRAVGYDSVKVTKVNKDEYLIDFAPIDAYENFIIKLNE